MKALKVQWDIQSFEVNSIKVTSEMKQRIEEMVDVEQNPHLHNGGINHVTFIYHYGGIETPPSGRIGIKREDDTIWITYITKNTEKEFFGYRDEEYQSVFDS